MTKFRDFGAPVSLETSEPISFSLYGETFNCKPQIPGQVMLDLAARSGKNDDGAESASVIIDFFKYVLLPESQERFSALCVDPVRIVTIDQLMDIVSWLMEIYGERPTTRSGVSVPGQ